MPGRLGSSIRKVVFLTEFPSIVAGIVISIALSFFSPYFWSPKIWEVILSFGSRVGIVAAGVCILMVSGEFDLSVYSVATLTPIISFSLWWIGWDVWVATIVGLIFAGAVGYLNALITLRGGIPSFVATLGTGYIFLSVDLWLTGSSTLAGPTDPLYHYVMGSGFFLAGTWTTDILWFIAIIIIMQILLARTRHGNWTLASGGNRTAAEAIGVNVVRTKTINFMICSVLAGLSGQITLSELSAANANTELGLMLLAIVAVTLGGTGLYGGFGTEFGVMIGSIVMGVVFIGVDIAGVISTWYEGVFGIVLVIIIVINERVRRAKMRIRS